MYSELIFLALVNTDDVAKRERYLLPIFFFVTILFIPQVIKMLVIVVLIFAICWFPWQAYMTLGLITPAINE